MEANNRVYQNYLYFTLHQKECFYLMQSLNRNAAQPGLAQPDIKRTPIIARRKEDQYELITEH